MNGRNVRKTLVLLVFQPEKCMMKINLEQAK
jgi:hypothetical protein